MVFTEVAMEMELRELQKKKANRPMIDTEEGIDTELNEQDLKAKLPISVTVVGIKTVVTFGQLSNALSAIETT